MAVSSTESAAHGFPGDAVRPVNLSVRRSPHRPLALVVLLENVGYIAGRNLPGPLMAAVDYLTEEYAKLALRFHGVYRHYDRVVILEDAQATAAQLVQALQEVGPTHTVDVLLLVHGLEGCLVGFRGQHHVDGAGLQPLLDAYRADPGVLDLRAVYGVNCFGASLAPTWLALGADAVAGAVGVNWFPEPGLSLFLRHWLGGAPFSHAVSAAYQGARQVTALLTLGRARRHPPGWLTSSRPLILGVRDPRLHEGEAGG